MRSELDLQPRRLREQDCLLLGHLGCRQEQHTGVRGRLPLAKVKREHNTQMIGTLFAVVQEVSFEDTLFRQSFIQWRNR